MHAHRAWSLHRRREMRAESQACARLLVDRDTVAWGLAPIGVDALGVSRRSNEAAELARHHDGRCGSARSRAGPPAGSPRVDLANKMVSTWRKQHGAPTTVAVVKRRVRGAWFRLAVESDRRTDETNGRRDERARAPADTSFEPKRARIGLRRAGNIERASRPSLPWALPSVGVRLAILRAALGMSASARALVSLRCSHAAAPTAPSSMRSRRRFSLPHARHPPDASTSRVGVSESRRWVPVRRHAS